MDYFRTILSEFFIDLKAQKLRSLLTMFGIIWGTVAITVLVAFGVGFQKQMAINMHGIGESIAIVWPGSTTKPWEGYGTGRSIALIEEDVHYVMAQVPGIQYASPEFNHWTTARVNENILNPLVAGVYPGYEDMRNIIPESGGRFINEMDNKHRRRVVFIGDKVKDFLFGETDPIGRILHIADVPFTVVGVMQKKTQNSSYNSRDQDRLYIPSTTYQSVFGRYRISNMIYQVVNPTEGEQVADDVRAALGRKYKYDPTDRNAIWIWDTTQGDRFFYYFFLGLNVFLGLIGSFTLGVAGLGVANIMFIVVQERIKEIGIKRALGAKKRTIMFQFFAETVFILLLGAAIGFLMSFGIVQGLQYIPIKDFVGTPELSMTVVMVTVSVLTVIGLFAGLFPARRAANLEVVDCLRA